MGTIVVGLDGSEGSRKALRWTALTAPKLGADVRAVYVFDSKVPWREFPYADSMTAEQMVDTREVLDRQAAEARRHAEGLLRSTVAEVAEDAGSGVVVEPVLVLDRQPAEALVKQAEGADMLVVGSRGRGGFAGLLLGSVSQQCLHHASCPVVVIPPAADLDG